MSYDVSGREDYRHWGVMPEPSVYMDFPAQVGFGKGFLLFLGGSDDATQGKADAIEMDFMGTGDFLGVSPDHRAQSPNGLPVFKFHRNGTGSAPSFGGFRRT
ncbi:hypothetical protein CARN8_4770002 [mine drainage metagenome]|uniref:Uncharacterized protein n=1 Tax=mine drainage metagenome TaxID=410659 RepID=A0A3P3ZQ31_9ZZZZ